MDYKQTPEEFNEIPNEFSSDFVVETENVVTTEIPAVPENPSAPQNPLFAPEYEQVASDDRYNYGNDEPENEYTAEEQDNFEEDYSIEAADEYYGNNDDAEYFAPEDEQAATSDKFDVTDGCEKCKLDDYEIISDVLGSEKQIVKQYSTALCEAAEENFRNVLRESLEYAAQDQYKAFEYMQRRGMYKTEQASENDLTQAKQQLNPLCENSNIGWNDCNCNNVECGCDNGCCCETSNEYCDCDPCCGDGACDIDD